jgi:hypothetical protein
MDNCGKCGNSDWRVVKDASVMVTIRCQMCSHEQTIHLNIPLELPPDFEFEPVFTVMARWSWSPTTPEIDELRATFPLMPVTTAEIVGRPSATNGSSSGNPTSLKCERVRRC